MRHRKSIAACAAAAVLPLAAFPISLALAKEVRYPTAHPEISLNVPDEWTVTETPLGLELQSPEKDALVVAGVTASDRKSVDGWSHRALERMGTEGVVFNKSGSAKQRASKVAGPDVGATIADVPTVAAAPQGAPKQKETPPDLAKVNGDRPYTFGGAPTLSPKITGDTGIASNPIHAGDIDLPTISSVTAQGGNPGVMKPSGHFAYTGGVLRGQPVDVELAVYPLGKDKRLLIEQQSGPTDARGVMIVRSLRDLDLTR